MTPIPSPDGRPKTLASLGPDHQPIAPEMAKKADESGKMASLPTLRSFLNIKRPKEESAPIEEAKEKASDLLQKPQPLASFTFGGKTATFPRQQKFDIDVPKV
jgi:hypothetical protein